MLSAVTLLPEPDFADDAQDLGLADPQVGAGNRVDRAAGRLEAGHQALDGEQRAGWGRGRHQWPRGLNRLLMASPAMLKLAMVMEMTTPGAISVQGA